MRVVLRGLPERTIAFALLRRSAVIWLLVRCTFALFNAAKTGHGAFGLTTPAAAWLILVVGALGFVEARRRNEVRFLANLGVAPATVFLMSAMPALVAEVVIGGFGRR